MLDTIKGDLVRLSVTQGRAEMLLFNHPPDVLNNGVLLYGYMDQNWAMIGRQF